MRIGLIGLGRIGRPAADAVRRTGVRFPAGPPAQFFMDRLASAFQRELATFTEVVSGTIPSPCTIQDALETGWVAEACALSLAEHRPVRIDEVRL